MKSIILTLALVALVSADVAHLAYNYQQPAPAVPSSGYGYSAPVAAQRVQAAPVHNAPAPIRTPSVPAPAYLAPAIPSVGYGYSAPIVAQPVAPVHHAPAPVHHAPDPVHHAPAPVRYSAPAEPSSGYGYSAPVAVQHAERAPVYQAPTQLYKAPAPVQIPAAPTAHASSHSQVLTNEGYQYKTVRTLKFRNRT